MSLRSLMMTASRPRNTATDPPGGSSPARGSPALGLSYRDALEQRRRLARRRLVGDVVEAAAQQGVLARVVEQEGVVPVRRLDLGIAHRVVVVEQRLHELARARRREAPVGGEAHELEAALRVGERGGQIAAVLARRVEVVERAGDEQVGVGVEVVAELVALVAQVALDLEFDVLRAVGIARTVGLSAVA